MAAQVENKFHRSPNFTAAEKSLLIDLLEAYKEVVENKRTDALTIKAKEEAWKSLAEDFNKQSTGGVVRNALQLKALWWGIKKSARKYLTAGKADETNGELSPMIWWEVDAHSNSRLSQSADEAAAEDSKTGVEDNDCSAASSDSKSPGTVPIYITSSTHDPDTHHRAPTRLMPTRHAPRDGGPDANRRFDAFAPEATTERKLELLPQDDRLVEMELMERRVRVRHLKRMNELEAQEKELMVKERRMDLEHKQQQQQLNLAHKQRLQQLELRLKQEQVDAQTAQIYHAPRSQHS